MPSDLCGSGRRSLKLASSLGSPSAWDAALPGADGEPGQQAAYDGR